MVIPIFGLPDTATIKTKEKTSDGYGGLTITETELITSWRYRKTIPRPRGIEELTMRESGQVSGDSWYFTGEYNSSISEGQLIVDSNNVKYEIMDIEVKRDAFGNNHHLLVTAEKI